jgi:xylulokinase
MAAFDSPAVAQSEDSWRVLIERAESSPPGSGGVVFYPYVFGSYGPRLDELARGAFAGLRNTTSQSHLARALFEGLNYHTRHALESMTDATGSTPGRIVCMGGGSKNRFWMQNRADILGRPIEVTEDADVTPRGAAMLAGVGIGFFESFEDAAARFVPRCVTIEPDPGLTDAYAEIYRNVFRPLGDALAPVNHAIAASAASTPENGGTAP